MKQRFWTGRAGGRLAVMVSVSALVAGLALPSASSTGTAAAEAVPDAVVTWNEHATTALIVTGLQPPPVAILHLAMVHGAVYDAVNAIDGGYEP